MKKTKSIIALLSMVSVVASLWGCTKNEKIVAQPIVPDKQIFEDQYVRNPEITDNMSYTLDYIYPKNRQSSEMEMVKMFDLMRIQVDDWQTIVLGKDSLGTLTSYIDAANKKYVETKTQEIIDKRQAEIDKAYNAEKAAAEKKGKTYTKPKKQVRTDDIHFNEPYEYKLMTGSGDDVEYIDYSPTYLVDPSVNSKIVLVVRKYNIPYVQFSCSRHSNLYNNSITQESDWTVTGVVAADVTSSIKVDEKSKKKKKDAVVEYPSYYDSDGRNKAAKKNIVMSGNIAFGGDGFNWDSLLLFCNALDLSPSSNGVASFKRSTNDKFAFYVINLCGNPQELFDNAFESGKGYYPIITLEATFDKLTQTCLNWQIDMCYVSARSIQSGKDHVLISDQRVNVHDYTVDTNDYQKMRDDIDKWIDARVIGQTKYCAFDEKKSNAKNGGFIGIVDTGLTNVAIEPSINGETYICLNSKTQNDIVTGTYIKEDEYNKASTMGEKKDSYIEAHSVSLKIQCCIVKDEQILCKVTSDGVSMTGVDGNTIYQVARLIKENGEYKDVALLTADDAKRLLTLYINTYNLSSDEITDMTAEFETKGLVGVNTYIYELFKDAETLQSNKDAKPEDPFSSD